MSARSAAQPRYIERCMSRARMLDRVWIRER